MQTDKVSLENKISYKVQIYLSYDWASPLLSIYPNKMKPMFTQKPIQKYV